MQFMHVLVEDRGQLQVLSHLSLEPEPLSGMYGLLAGQ